MTPLVTRMLSVAGLPRAARLGSCMVCRESVTERDERMHLHGGGWVHRSCATYRMRRRHLRGR